MRIKKGGINRVCSKEDYERVFRGQGYEIVEEIDQMNNMEDENELIENIEQLEEVEEVKEIEVPTVNLMDYHKGGGWYEYEGKSYRKDELLEVIK